MIMTNMQNSNHQNQSSIYESPHTQKRARLSGEQLSMLLSEFQINPHPSPESRRKISEKVGLTERSVRIWFQNRRAKNRKEEREKKAIGISGSDGTFKDNGITIAIHINENFDFIHCFSVTIGSWQRLQHENAINMFFIPKLNSINPVDVEQLMLDPMDLSVIYSKKHQEINYFFVSSHDNQRVLFRIYYSLHDIASFSTANDKINPFNMEISILLNKPPRFAVRIANEPNSTWSSSGDFTHDKSVINCFYGLDGSGNRIPHQIMGRIDSIRYLDTVLRQTVDVSNSANPGALSTAGGISATGGNGLSITPVHYSPPFSSYNFPPIDSSSHSHSHHSHSASQSSIYSLASPAQTPTQDIYGFNPVYSSPPASGFEQKTLQPNLQSRQFFIPIPAQQEFFYDSRGSVNLTPSHQVQSEISHQAPLSAPAEFNSEIDEKKS